jgi:hypothetical protein
MTTSSDDLEPRADASIVSPRAPSILRRCLRFRLRSLFVLVTAAGVVCALWVYPAERERRATQALRLQGSTVEYELAIDLDGAPAIVRWAHGLLGDPYFGHVVSATCMDCDDADLEHLQAFREIETVVIWNGERRNAGLAHVRGLRRLKVIVLSYGQGADAELGRLKDVPALEELAILGFQVAEGDWTHLQQFRDLVDLSLVGATLSDGAVRKISELKSLEAVSFTQCEMSSESLSHLRTLPRLRDIGLFENGIGDEGLAHLAEIPTLRSVSLFERTIHVAGLRRIAELPLDELSLVGQAIDDDAIDCILHIESLKSLYFAQCKITENGYL